MKMTEVKSIHFVLRKTSTYSAHFAKTIFAQIPPHSIIASRTFVINLAIQSPEMEVAGQDMLPVLYYHRLNTTWFSELEVLEHRMNETTLEASKAGQDIGDDNRLERRGSWKK